MCAAPEVPLRNLGPAIAPDHSWIFLQGLETLPLRSAPSRNRATARSVLFRAVSLFMGSARQFDFASNLVGHP